MTPYQVHQRLARLAGVPWCTGRYNLNLTVIRAVTPDSSELFDDALALSYEGPVVDGVAPQRTVLLHCTTDPGRPYRLAPLRPDGCVILCPQYAHLSHGLGLHRGRPALVQVGPLRAWRDNDRDGELDRTGTVYTLDRSCAVNIHDGPGDAAGPAPGVGRWSAGCVVTQRKADMVTILSAVHAQHAAGRGDRVSLLLVDLHGLTGDAALAAQALLDTTRRK